MKLCNKDSTLLLQEYFFEKTTKRFAELKNMLTFATALRD